MQGENDENCSRTEYNSIISFTYAVRNKITEKKKSTVLKGGGVFFFLKRMYFLIMCMCMCSWAHMPKILMELGGCESPDMDNGNWA